MATKKAPIVKDAQFSRIFNDIYKTLNELSNSSDNGAGKMATTKTGIRVNNAKFKLTKYDTLTYNNTVLSVLNERAGETSTIKLGSLAKFTSFQVAKTGDLTLDAAGDISLDADGGEIYFKDGGTTFGNVSTDGAYSSMTLYEDGGASSDDFFQIYTGGDARTTIRTVDAAGTIGHLILSPDGDLKLDPVSQKIIINATDKLYFDGGGDSYIVEHTSDHVRHVVGGDVIVTMTENGDDGNQTYFVNSSVGFTQQEPTYDASNTLVDFRQSNKQNLTFGSGSITNVNLYFPNMSGNFVLVLKQDGTGSRTVTNWRLYESDESTADGEVAVKWAGGSAPTLTTDATHVDIISFYWDNDNEIAYGVATLDFQF